MARRVWECMHHGTANACPVSLPNPPNPARMVMVAVVGALAPATLFEPSDVSAQPVRESAHAWWTSVHSPDRTHTRHAFDNFCRAFADWKTQDVQRLVEVLVVSWIHLDDTRQHQQCPPALSAHIRRTQETMVVRAGSLGVEETAFREQVEAMATAAHTPDGDGEADTTATTATPTLISTIHRAFWDDFRDRLRRHDTAQLRAMLRELLDAIHALTPNRPDLHQELERAVDIDLLAQMVEHESMDTGHFVQTTRAVVDHLRRLVAPVREGPLGEWFVEWMQVGEGDGDGGGTFEELLQGFFERVHLEVGVAGRGCFGGNPYA